MTGLLGLGFGRMTFAITEANSLLRQKTTDDLAREEDETGCGTHCISQKTNAIIKEMGPAIKDSLLKLGLSKSHRHFFVREPRAHWLTAVSRVQTTWESTYT